MMILNKYVNRFLRKAKEITAGKKNSPFVDLTPVDDADQDGSYSNALSFALENPRINNIALTGPYGSGKSSIIRTYEKKSDYKFLNISLASFKEDQNNSVNTILIERSILQQMLYGADANKLPYSRFKRISTPEHPIIKSLIMVFWVLAVFYLYQFRYEILNLTYFSCATFSRFLLFGFVLAIPVTLISTIYKASFGVSLKKFSLKNAEIETGELSENSILNRHLDEIIYFFQETDYNVVVIEDLDRFGDPEIFVKLREINKLINDNEKTHGQIKFLYALKDDMFAHKNRTKFFDMIIPVVPIINYSNSLDMMQKRLKKHEFAQSIDQQFLREASLYIDDLRLIHNIFNEFVIYYERLKSDSLDVTKLLAMMIYKNVYPNDFENLHHGKGALFEICEKKPEYIEKAKEQLKEKIEKLENLLELANTEQAGSIQELIDTYIGHIMMYSNKPVVGIVCNNQHVLFRQRINMDQFQAIISDQNIQLATDHSSHVHYRTPTNRSFSQIEEEINPGKTFLSRKENIENKADEKKIELQQQIHQVEKEVSDLSQVQLLQVLKIGDIGLDELIVKHKIADGRLLIYLVRNGYLDDNYYLYISNFHEGRLTKNDRDYLLTIRNFSQPEPTQKIDTPKEICANMRDEDFSSKYVLNITLIDYLLENSKKNSKRIEAVMHYIAQNFELTNDFFAVYFKKGKSLGKFVGYLSHRWPGFAAAAINSKHGDEQIANILIFVEADYISENMNIDNLLTTYLSEHGQLVFVSEHHLPDDYNVLKKLNVRFHDLAALDKNNAVLEIAHTESLYIINSKNVNFILKKFTEEQNIDTMKPEKANYTSILAAGSNSLKEYIEENLPIYIENVFLTLPDNSEESEPTIKKLINHETLDDDLKKQIVSKQEHVFETFENISQNLWPHLMQEGKVVATWKNIIEYLSYEDNDTGVVSNLLDRENIVATLMQQNISSNELGEDKSKSLSGFIFENNEISDTSYCTLIAAIPYWYSNFPDDVSKEKNYCLARKRKVRLTEESFSFSKGDNQLTTILIGKNFTEYLGKKEEYPINDDIREMLLSSDLKNENKIIVCDDVTPAGAIANKNLSRLIANLIVINKIDCSKVDDDILTAAIVNAQPISESIRLLMMCLSKWDEGKTMEVLRGLPEPYSEIPEYGKRPKLDNNEWNRAFANLLKAKDFISSVKQEDDSIKINTFNSSDHSEGTTS